MKKLVRVWRRVDNVVVNDWWIWEVWDGVRTCFWVDDVNYPKKR